MSILCCIPLYHPVRERLFQIVSQLLHYRIRVFLVDNSSNGIHVDYQLPQEVIIYRPKKNIGTAGAYNEASDFLLTSHEYKWLLLLDQDSSVGSNYLDFCLNASQCCHSFDGIYAPADAKAIPVYSRRPLPLLPHNSNYSLRAISDAKASGLLIPDHALASSIFCKSLYVDYVDWVFCWQARKVGYTIYETRALFLHEHNLGNTYSCLFGSFVLNLPSKSRRRLQTASALYMISNVKFFDHAPLLRFLSITIRPVVNIILNIYESLGLIRPLP